MNYLKTKAKQSIISLFFLTLLFQITSCKDKIPPALEEGDDDSLFIPGEPKPPIDSVDNPEDSPIELFGHIRIQWSPQDYKETFFDAAKHPIRAVRENLFEDGSTHTIKNECEFFYDEKGFLKQVKSKQSVVNYFYEEEKVTETREYSARNILLKIRSYVYSANKLVKVLETNNLTQDQIQHRYFYDDRGNLKEKREYTKNKVTGDFENYTAARYSEYDVQRNVENLWRIYPFLPEVSFGNNNFGKISFFQYDGVSEKEVSRRKYFNHEYDKNGYPLVVEETGSSASIIAKYSYSGF